MTNEVVEAISKRLYGLFPDWAIYPDDTVQNIELPAFIIKPVGAQQRERLGERVFFDELYSVAVVCPGNIRKLREATELAAINLRFIDMPDGMPLMAKNRESTMVNGEQANITFTVTRSIWHEREAEPIQLKLIHKIGVKEND